MQSKITEASNSFIFKEIPHLKMFVVIKNTLKNVKHVDLF